MSYNCIHLIQKLKYNHAAKSTLLAIALHAKGDGSNCFASINKLAQDMSKSKRAVNYALKALVQDGLISKSQRRLKNGKFSSNIYEINVQEMLSRINNHVVDNFKNEANFSSSTAKVALGDVESCAPLNEKMSNLFSKNNTLTEEDKSLTPILTPYRDIYINNNVQNEYFDLDEYDQIIDETNNVRKRDTHVITDIDSFLTVQNNLDQDKSPNKCSEVKELPISNKLVDEKFDEFWFHYSVKKNKCKAKEIWLSKVHSLALADTIINDVMRRKRVDPQWRSTQYIPHASTYLANKRWEDEIIKFTEERLYHRKPPSYSEYNPYACMKNYTEERLQKGRVGYGKTEICTERSDYD